MSEISKNIVSLIISKEFHKAKTLIHEAMNNKLGFLLEEKLLEYAPTLYEGGDTEYSSALGGERYNNQTETDEDTEPEIDNTELFKRFSAASSGTDYNYLQVVKNKIFQKFPDTDFRKLAKIQQKTNSGDPPPTDWHEYSTYEDHDKDAKDSWEDYKKSHPDSTGEMPPEYVEARDKTASERLPGQLPLYPTQGYKTPDAPDAVNDTLNKIKKVTGLSALGSLAPVVADWTVNNKVSKSIGIPGSSLLGKVSNFASKNLIFPVAAAHELVDAAQDTYNDDWGNPGTAAANLVVNLGQKAAYTSILHPKVLSAVVAGGSLSLGTAVAAGVPVGAGVAYAYDKITGAKEGEGNLDQFQDWDTYKPKNIVAGAQEWVNQYYQRISGNDPYAAVSKDKGIPLPGPIMPPPDRPEGPKGQPVAAGTVKNGNGQVMYK